MMIRMWRFTSRAIPVAAAALSATLAGAQSYQVIRLGTLGGNDSEARGINIHGHVVGWAEVASNANHAFYWNGSFMEDLGTLGGVESNCRAINDSGVMCGRADYNSWYQHAFRSTGNGLQDLGALGGQESSAYDINSDGEIVGWADVSTGAPHAFLWRNNNMQDLGTLGGYSSRAQGINENGEVCGYSHNSQGHIRAFFWRNGNMVELPTLGGARSFAFELNDDGVVVGEGDTPEGPHHATMWVNGVPTDLGTLGGPKSSAWDINNAGQIVGFAENATANNRAFLWENGQMKNLNDLIPFGSGWLLKEAIGINENGEIVGRGTFEGETVAFLLIPQSGDILTLDAPDPGTAGQPNTFDAHGGTPGERVRFAYAFRTGSTPISGCQVSLSLDAAVEFGADFADANGDASITVNVPGQARGRTVFFQAFEPSSCRVTNLVTHTFD